MTKYKEVKNKPPKVKVHVTIDEELVKWMDAQIQARNFHNMSHAIEKALYELMKNHSMKNHSENSKSKT